MDNESGGMLMLFWKIKLKFHSLILSILTGRKVFFKVVPNGATVSKKKLDDGRTAEIYIDHGEYKCRFSDPR